MTTTLAPEETAGKTDSGLEPIKNRIGRILENMPPSAAPSPPTPEQEEQALQRILLSKGVFPVHLGARLNDFHNPPETPPVFIHGGAGVGKTHLAVAYLVREIQTRGEASRVFIRSVDLMNRLRDSFRSSYNQAASEIISASSRYRFLVIDDLGAGRHTDLVQEAVYDLLDFRAGHRLPTVITSNFSLDRVANHYGDFGGRIVSRIVGMGEILTLKGRDRRLPAGQPAPWPVRRV